MTDGRFRERRSAFSEESASGTETASPAPAPDGLAEQRETEPPVPSERPADEVLPSDTGPAQAISPDADLDPDLDRLAGMEIPPASFLELVERHVEDALRFLGQLPLTPQGDRRLLPDLARHEIDLLGILEQRTRGNLPSEEKQYLDQALDQLRTLYLRVAR